MNDRLSGIRIVGLRFERTIDEKTYRLYVAKCPFVGRYEIHLLLEDSYPIAVVEFCVGDHRERLATLSDNGSPVFESLEIQAMRFAVYDFENRLNDCIVGLSETDDDED